MLGNQSTALISAAEHGHVAASEVLLEHDVQLDLRNDVR